MRVKFTKDHPSGLKSGMCTTTDEQHGKMWIDKGIAKKIDESEYKKWVKEYYNPTPKKKQSKDKE